MKCGTIIITLTFIMNFTGGELVSPWSFEDDIVWFILSFVLVFWWWYCVIYFIICALNFGKYRHMVQCFVHSSTAIFVYTVVKMLWTHSQVSLQQISNHCDRVQHYCQLWYKKKRFWCCSLLCSLGTHLVTISSGQWQLHMYKKMFR